MKPISIGHNKLAQSLAFATVLLFSAVGITHARGYGSGGGEGQNHNYYIPMAEARFFAVYDFNRDGFLSLEEVTAMGMPVRTFKQTDSNKNGKLCKDEFAKMWASPPK
jgi:hypothetical protein